MYFCAAPRLDVNDTLPVAKKLIEGSIFQPDPLEARWLWPGSLGISLGWEMVGTGTIEFRKLEIRDNEDIMRISWGCNGDRIRM